MKKQKGITLIALIITIIVLLILATVSIKLLIDQGIIGRAQSATEQHTVADEKERIKLGYNDYKIAQIENSETAELKVSGATVITNGENSWLITFEKTGNQYELKDGNITQIKEIEPVELEVGSYVHYDVEYTDMYSGQTFNADNGWRYLGKDDAGNNLIVSTGIPAELRYNYNARAGVEVNGWWGTDDEVRAEYGDTYATGYNNYPNRYAAYGMKYKFESIPFNYDVDGVWGMKTENTGKFKKVGAITSGTLPSTAFRADGVKVIGVHNLTLEELNRATNKASGSNRGDDEYSAGFKDLEGTALGLFDMRKLNGYGESYYYWLASPYSRSTYGVERVFYDLSNVTFSDNNIQRRASGSCSVI